MTDLATIDLGGRFWGPVNLRQSEVLIEAMDFEPGELKNGSMLSKKRKFSPIVWDGYEVSSLSGNSFSKSCRQSTNFVSTGSLQISSALFHSSRPQVKSVVSAATDDALSSSLIQGQQSECAGKQDIETSHEFVKFRREGSERLQEQFDNAGGTRNRWSGGDKYADKSVSHDAGGTHRRWFGGDEYADKSVSHDAGGTRSRWSGGDDFADKSESHSAGVPRSRWSGGDEDADKKLDEDHNMEANKEPHYGVSSLGGDTESEGEGEGEGGFHDTPETDVPLQRRGNMVQGCRSLDDFKLLNKIGEGTYGVVYKAEDKITGETVALKKIKINREVEDEEGFPLTSLREINILLSFDHPSIINLKEVVVGSTIDLIFMVMEYMEHDLKEVTERKKQAFSLSEVKCLMLQLLEGVKYLHDNWVLHRDLKTSNLLLNNSGELKICDFGMSRQYGSPLKCYTQLVVTLWYRAPELLLGAKQYSTAVDMWSVGCIMAELLLNKPLFNGETEIGQIDKIFRTLGTPNEATWPGFSKLPGAKVKYVKQPHNLLNKKFPAISFTGAPTISNAGFDLLNNLLTYDPEKRITADAALNHQWFREVPLPKSKDSMPTLLARDFKRRPVRRAA